MMRRENQSLWRVRHLWTALCGDHTWVPCEDMLGPNDVDLYTDDHVARHLLSLSKNPADGPEATLAKLPNGTGKPKAEADRNTNEGTDVPMTDAEPTDDKKNGSADNAEPKTGGRPDDSDRGLNGRGKHASQSLTNGNSVAPSAANESAGGDGQPGVAQNAPSVASEATEDTFVHPMFLPPAGVKSDRNIGLPENEAEDVRRLLSFFVQKQEEVCRGARRLHDGLAKAQRLRNDVLRWSKAEAHSGENRDMSDGEDWYDKEEWGLSEDLKKGQDDEEEDTTTTSKKTRARR